MQEYADKNALVEEIEKTAGLFMGEFDTVSENDRDTLLEGVDRTPRQMIAYQLGWMKLLLSWEADELSGKEPITPAEGYKWNQLGGLYQAFYKTYEDKSLAELKELFEENANQITDWLRNLDEEVLFQAGVRKWASSTPSCWPVWKWVHINTVAPFKTFRTKIRKWKKLRMM